jgi:predicted ATPase
MGVRSADAFVGEAASTNDNHRRNKVNFLIETHSEPLINRLGQLINSGRISAQDVHIVLFEPDPDLLQYTKTSIATFGPDGTLVNWPYGFFQPVVD